MLKIAFVSQTGSVMKTALAMAMAVEGIKRAGWKVGVADLDTEHRTAFTWMEDRKQLGKEPLFKIHEARSVEHALTLPTKEQLFIFDCPSRASQATHEIAKHCDLIIQPVLTGSTKDGDLSYAIFDQLLEAGIPMERLAFIMTRYMTDTELDETRAFFDQSKIVFPVLESALPERHSFRKAISEGYAITETSFHTVNALARQAVSELYTHLLESVECPASRHHPKKTA